MNQQGSCAVLDPSLASGQELQDSVYRLDGFGRSHHPQHCVVCQPAGQSRSLLLGEVAHVLVAVVAKVGTA